VHFLAALLVTEHLNDLLREAEAERQSALVRGARRSAWSAFTDRLAGLLRRLAGSRRRGSVPPRPAGPNPATA
jgi:hypothetical protein